MNVLNTARAELTACAQYPHRVRLDVSYLRWQCFIMLVSVIDVMCPDIRQAHLLVSCPRAVLIHTQSNWAGRPASVSRLIQYHILHHHPENKMRQVKKVDRAHNHNAADTAL